MGVVIFTGLSIGTLFTLFVVPAMYAFLAGRHAKSREATGAYPLPPATALTPDPFSGLRPEKK